MAKVLTDLGVKNAKPKRHQGKAVITEIPDGGCRGLRLVLHPTGHRSWIVRYRRPDGRTAKLTLGPAIVVRKGDPVPEHALTLALARKRATDALHQLALGIDPGIEKAASRQPTTHTTFERVATDCFTREANRGLRSAVRQLHDLQRLVFPVFGKRPMAAVRRGDVVRLLDRIEDEHGAVMAHAVLAGVRKVMNWWAVRDENYAVPLVRGMRRSNPRERARARILNDDELRAVWKAASEMEAPYGPFIQFLLLVGCRRREAAGMRRDEVPNGLWTLPASRSKTKKEVVRPLSRAAQSVLHRIPKIAGSEYVFTLGGGVPINSFHLLKQMIDERSGVMDWRLHDCRRTARSLMSRANVSADIAERCLGHAMPRIRGTYDQHDYVPQTKLAFEALAQLIEQIVEPQDNVVEMTTRR
jgi:integrase